MDDSKPPQLKLQIPNSKPRAPASRAALAKNGRLGQDPIGPAAFKMNLPGQAAVGVAMPYRIFVKDTTATPWREVKQLEDNNTGAADVDRLAASGQYHAVELRKAESGDGPVYTWTQRQTEAGLESAV